MKVSSGLRIQPIDATHLSHSRRVAKAKGGATIAAASIDHLHRYIELLFQPAKRKRKETS
jgi:hypothetical protein